MCGGDVALCQITLTTSSYRSPTVVLISKSTCNELTAPAHSDSGVDSAYKTQLDSTREAQIDLTELIRSNSQV